MLAMSVETTMQWIWIMVWCVVIQTSLVMVFHWARKLVRSWTSVLLRHQSLVATTNCHSFHKSLNLWPLAGIPVPGIWWILVYLFRSDKCIVLYCIVILILNLLSQFSSLHIPSQNELSADVPLNNEKTRAVCWIFHSNCIVAKWKCPLIVISRLLSSIFTEEYWDI